MYSKAGGQCKQLELEGFDLVLKRMVTLLTVLPSVIFLQTFYWSAMSIFLRNSVPRILASYHRVISTRHLSSSTVTLKDPWPMPHTPEHIVSTASPADLPPPEPLPRPGETIETTRARLIYQSRKRGTLESDLLLSTFAKEHLGAMDAEELSEFDKVRAFIQARPRLIPLL